MSSHYSASRLLLLSATFAAAACGPRSSRTTVPTPSGPIVAPSPANLPPVVPPVSPAPAPRAFAYGPGSYRYEVRNDATVSTVGGETRSDTILMRAIISYRLVRGTADSLLVTGTVDTFTVSGGRAAGASPLASPLPFSFTIGPSGRRLETVPDSSGVCSSPASTMVATARDLLLDVPVVLGPAAAWQDSTSSVVCRGMIPVTTRSTRTSRVEWTVTPPEMAGQAERAAFRVLRSGATVLSGSGQAAGREITITGDGSTTSAYYLDPRLGVLVGAVGDAATRLLVDTGTQRQEFLQQVRQRITLLR